jgi:hypothetical protein
VLLYFDEDNTTSITSINLITRNAAEEVVVGRNYQIKFGQKTYTGKAMEIGKYGDLALCLYDDTYIIGNKKDMKKKEKEFLNEKNGNSITSLLNSKIKYYMVRQVCAGLF